MPKIVYIIMISLGLVLGIILIIENMIGSAGTVYTLIWQSTAHTLVFFTLICGVLVGYGLKGLFTSNSDDDNHETF